MARAPWSMARPVGLLIPAADAPGLANLSRRSPVHGGIRRDGQVLLGCRLPARDERAQPWLGKCQRLAVVSLTNLVEPMGCDAIVARLVHAVKEQSGPTERMVVPAESVDDSPPAERLDLDVTFGQPQGIASWSAA